MFGLRSFVLVVTLLVTTLPSSRWLSESQQSTPKSTPSIQRVPPTKGQVESGIYKNDSIGLQFTPAESLHLQAPEITGTPGTTSLVVEVKAIAEWGLLSLFSARNLTIFYAEALAYYPEEQRNPARYLKKVVRANEADGYQHVDGKSSDEISGVSFMRADFIHTKSRVYEVVLVTTHNDYAFVFIFAGSDVGAVNKMVASTKVKFIPQK
jgi:hypothetical protein